MLMRRERELVVDYCRKMVHSGLTKGTSGNISIFNKDEGLLAISPTGMDYFLINPIDVVVMDLSGNIVEGDCLPSTEYELHAIFYRNRPELGAVIHCHSIYCTTYSCLEQPLLAVYYGIGICGKERVECAPYETYGTKQLAEVTYNTCLDNNAVLMGHHGLLTCGKDVEEAFTIAENVEFAAEIQYRAQVFGDLKVIDSKRMAGFFERVKSHGQKPH